MDWWRKIYVALKNADVRQIVYVPDAGHAELIDVRGLGPGDKTIDATENRQAYAWGS